MISMIAAIDRNGVIGVDNKLPWSMPADLKFFRDKTRGHHVIMGRKTYESMGRPLPDRPNVVITRQKGYKLEGARVVHSLDEALAIARAASEVETFIIGGADIFEIGLPLADRIYLTEIDFEVSRGDAYFPKLDHRDWQVVEERVREPDEKNKHRCTFLTYARRR